MGSKAGASKDQLEFWLAVKIGDFVTLSDSQSFIAGGSGGLDYRVTDIQRIVVRDRERRREIAHYHLHDLELEGKRRLSLLLLAAGEQFELRAYFRPGQFAAGTRDLLIDRGQTWLFLPPPNPDDFISSQLDYAPYPDVPPIDEGTGPVTRVYAIAGFGKPVYGSYVRNGEEVPTILTEYACDDKGCLNPLLLVVEERWIDPDGRVPEEGGFVTTFLGCPLSTGEVDLFPASGRR